MQKDDSYINHARQMKISELLEQFGILFKEYGDVTLGEALEQAMPEKKYISGKALRAMLERL